MAVISSAILVVYIAINQTWINHQDWQGIKKDYLQAKKNCMI
jgi:hypothetical protein